MSNNLVYMNMNEVREISVHEFQKMKEEGKPFFLVDVREPDELSICSINGVNIPLGQIDLRQQEFDLDIPVILHCKSGRRSEMAVLFLQQQYELENLYSLKGGIMEYAREIDPNLTQY